MTSQDHSAQPRQFSSFCFFRVDPAFRGLPAAKRRILKKNFLKAADVFMRKSKENLQLSFSTLGLRAETDFFLWRITYALEDLEEGQSALFKSLLGPYLKVSASYLAQTRRSIYVDRHVHEGQEGRRGRVVPGEYKYIFVYPFLKTREWYLLPLPERQTMMDEHIRIGHEYPSVKLNTTYSFGLDDQEFVVAFESDEPSDFLDLVMRLRESQASRYTLRDTPIYTGRRRPLKEILDLLG